MGATEENIRTGTGSHLSALAPESAGPLFLPLLSHSVWSTLEAAMQR